MNRRSFIIGSLGLLAVGGAILPEEKSGRFARWILHQDSLGRWKSIAVEFYVNGERKRNALRLYGGPTVPVGQEAAFEQHARLVLKYWAKAKFGVELYDTPLVPA